jgi:hypothetical protein
MRGGISGLVRSHPTDLITLAIGEEIRRGGGFAPIRRTNSDEE